MAMGNETPVVCEEMWICPSASMDAREGRPRAGSGLLLAGVSRSCDRAISSPGVREACPSSTAGMAGSLYPSEGELRVTGRAISFKLIPFVHHCGPYGKSLEG